MLAHYTASLPSSEPPRSGRFTYISGCYMVTNVVYNSLPSGVALLLTLFINESVIDDLILPISALRPAQNSTTWSIIGFYKCLEKS